MKYVHLPSATVHPLSFYLAMEEYVAHTYPSDDYFFMWQVCPTVIFGRNQVIENEVNIDYCREHNIAFFRRKSGGGCVYADMSNIMLSYITPSEKVNLTFNKYINLLLLVLQKMGIKATSSGRNDVLIDGKKVSGNAFYHIPGRSIVHGTLLYDTDIRHMTTAITPSTQKLTSKGVESVRQHIALLKDYTSLSLDEIKAFIRQHLCNDSITLTESDVEKIHVIQQEYVQENFIFGHNPHYTMSYKKRIEGVGEFDVCMDVKGNRIRDINLLGDFFLTGDLNAEILSRLKGCELKEEALMNALPNDVECTIMHLTKNKLVRLILNKQ